MDAARRIDHLTPAADRPDSRFACPRIRQQRASWDSRFFQKFGGRSRSRLQVHPMCQRKLMHGDPRRLLPGVSCGQPCIFRKLTLYREGIMRRAAGISVSIRTQEAVSIFPLSKTLDHGRIAGRPSRSDDDRRSPCAGVKSISCGAPADRTRFRT